ncbi:RsfA family transcriptional regulator [Tuberibacillus sp. Marseille-P3662]|uniref:RsfA family transcriptional regulator n=1 Tax=Tuberibacillus sp. Marseille-P3662 TaxID=1965358 RepID=UPI000A1CB05A|nr:RsfA family transcriptional regulator [Tuberibacillus sp. Marseille-P3662]
MSTVRQDAWNHDEDLLLAETVLRHIREGGTQLGAFEEVGQKLSRTSAACGFRWNSLVRKNYESAITVAKNKRKEQHAAQKKLKQPLSDEKRSQSTEGQSESRASAAKAGDNEQAFNLSSIIDYLQQLKNNELDSYDLEKENKTLKKQLEHMKKEKSELSQTLQTVERQYQEIEAEYQKMLSVMDRARKMMGLQDEDSISNEEQKMPEKINK